MLTACVRRCARSTRTDIRHTPRSTVRRPVGGTGPHSAASSRSPAAGAGRRGCWAMPGAFLSLIAATAAGFVQGRPAAELPTPGRRRPTGGSRPGRQSHRRNVTGHSCPPDQSEEPTRDHCGSCWSVWSWPRRPSSSRVSPTTPNAARSVRSVPARGPAARRPASWAGFSGSRSRRVPALWAVADRPAVAPVAACPSDLGVLKSNDKRRARLETMRSLSCLARTAPARTARRSVPPTRSSSRRQHPPEPGEEDTTLSPTPLSHRTSGPGSHPEST